VAALLCAHAARPAGADGIDPYVLKPSLDSGGGAYVERARGNLPGAFSVQTGALYLASPLRLEVNGQEARAIDWAVLGHVTLSVGLPGRLEISGQALVARQQHTDEPLVAAIAGSEEVGLVDPRIQAKLALYGQGDPLDLALALAVSLPAGEEDALLGDAGPSVEPRLLAGRRLGPLGVFVNLGGRLRQGITLEDPTGAAVLELGHELTYGLAADLDLGKVGLGAEAVGLVPLSAASSERSLHALGTVWFSPTPSVRFIVGGGAEVLGTAARRATAVAHLGVAWAPESGRFGALADRDHDGIADARDLCPDQPEDADGFEDADGCPDLDDDGDGVPDATDRCPRVPEDKDSFQDEDGCPELDNDLDGIPDDRDRCPGEAEDKDGFQDEDGCPELDNDGDGIPDDKDRCPKEAETFNAVDDEDGCPDQAIRTDRLSLPDPIPFAPGQVTLDAAAKGSLDAMAERIRAHPKTRIRIEGHAAAERAPRKKKNPPSPQALSEQRAQAVLGYLVGRGVDPAQLSAVGYGSSRPIVTEGPSTERRRNDRVELIVLE
jgi:outer membrane protein OmpA-like peptidoglycan-associated protein